MNRDHTGSSADDRQSRFRAGGVGGAMATLVMTLFREPAARSLPPTAHFLSRWLGGSPEDYPLSALAVHLLYGVGGGIGFGFAWRWLEPREEHPETVGLVAGALYGLALSVFGERVVLPYLVGMELEGDESVVFHAGHLVYGLTLGVWVGSRAGQS
ncbi:hypothetical protein ACFPYI_06315 [Halomarina salina]|uniref:DUF1440 domain-containing protein n=1 Tax=Halomarina salina TaxID=1872699 RepID=A0ABD5RKP8_9EURY